MSLIRDESEGLVDQRGRVHRFLVILLPSSPINYIPTMSQNQPQEENNLSQRARIKQQLKGFDFSQLGDRERTLMDQLGGYTYQSSFIDLLKRKFGGTNVREKYIDTNRMYLDGNDLAVLNTETINYKTSSTQGAIFITVFSTLSSLILGIAMLPTRKSPAKFTAVGLGTGIFLSYGFWRFQLYRYEEKINQLFHKVIREQYEEMKGQRI